MGQLTVSIAHEIRNPLNLINNFAALNIKLTKKLREQLEKNENRQGSEVKRELSKTLDKLELGAEEIRKHGQRANAIIERMLRHFHDSPKEEPLLTDVNAWLATYVRVAERGMRARRADFQAVIESDLDDSVGQIELWPQSLGQVVINLFDNALDALEEKQAHAPADYVPILQITSRRLPHHVEIRLKDNGNGIAGDIRGRIFDPFFTTKPVGAGTGLGLWISRDIVTDLHGGELWVESESGQYSAFCISLPTGPRAER